MERLKILSRKHICSRGAENYNEAASGYETNPRDPVEQRVSLLGHGDSSHFRTSQDVPTAPEQLRCPLLGQLLGDCGAFPSKALKLIQRRTGVKGGLRRYFGC